MWNLIFGNNSNILVDEYMMVEPNKSFTEESPYLKAKREELIAKDKHLDSNLLINNPSRKISLYAPTVLVEKQ